MPASFALPLRRKGRPAGTIRGEWSLLEAPTACQLAEGVAKHGAIEEGRAFCRIEGAVALGGTHGLPSPLPEAQELIAATYIC